MSKPMVPADVVVRDRLADLVCHDEQLEIWASQLLDELDEYIETPNTYDGVINMRRAAKRAVRDLVEGAFAHPELLGIPCQRVR